MARHHNRYRTGINGPNGTAGYQLRCRTSLGGLIVKWCLIEATDVDCTMDDSGVYTVIHRAVQGNGVVFVRADLMTTDDEPLVSFIGTANNVRQRLIAWMVSNLVQYRDISWEHASYIGYELLRAETDPSYVQD